MLGRWRRGKAEEPAVLDHLAQLPAAAPALVTCGGLSPTGAGGVCLRAPDPAAYPSLEERLAPILAATDPQGSARFEQSTDEFGHRWLVRRTSVYDLDGLVADLRSVNAAAVESGSAGALMCTMVAFTDARNPPMALVFRASRGTWYPFVPIADGDDVGSKRLATRDNPREIAIGTALEGLLALEPDLSKWFPVWGAPVL